MRPVLHGDIMVAARALLGVRDIEREAFFARLLRRASAAVAYRKRFRRAHPQWGNGTLAAVAMPYVRGPEPFADTPDYCRCLSIIFCNLHAWRMEKQGLNRPTRHKTSS